MIAGAEPREAAAVIHEVRISSACSWVIRCCGFRIACGMPPSETASDWLPAARRPQACCA